jgi:hypothetical protein
LPSVTTLAVVFAMLVCAGLLAPRRVRGSVTWRATVTPLASIVGSGFLVLAPILADTAGEWAPLAMAGVVALAFAIGATVRFNIGHAERLLATDDRARVLVDVERVSRFLLGLAYMISVAFYLRLLASFLLDAVNVESALAGRCITTAILAVIALVGWFRGLHGVESFEVPAVDIKLVVIAGLLTGMAVYVVGHPSMAVHSFTRAPVTIDGFTLFRRLAGMLLVVQGFETSRYLGRYYNPNVRIRTMRLAQIVSGTIYIAFAALVVPLFGHLGDGVRETAIVNAARFVSPLLAPLIIVAAMASQLSAAAADAAGGSEMITERVRNEAGNVGYLVVAAGAALVVWTTDVFGIVSVASRAFAGYYLCQVVVAIITAVRARPANYRRVITTNAVLAVVLAFVTVAAIPAG